MEYFSPNIEDIRVGYECDMTTPTKDWWTHDTWVTYVLKEQPCFWNSEISELSGAISKIELNQIRVPYLTKDAIKDEGWEILKKSDNNYIYASKGMSELRYDMEHTTLAVYNSVWKMTDMIKYPAYYGECRCKNEFRQIMKQIKL